MTRCFFSGVQILVGVEVKPKGQVTVSSLMVVHDAERYKVGDVFVGCHQTEMDHLLWSSWHFYFHLRLS